ncbi:HEPN domain-containing protein [Dactylosporangium sp. CA-139066]|uniref:HEPN domain-containing protein n=1 Tax=Dactylosporangium sp. CA-139066 TaxID=3239930 RepID=UPI003D8B580D
MRWQQGREALEGMLDRAELERVPPSRDHAELLLAQARKHLASADAIAASDPAGAYQLLYDAARKSLAAVLENEGLRVTSRGGHIAVRDAVTAQLDPPLGAVLRPFDRLRRRRNQLEYPSAAVPGISPEEVERDVPKVEQIIELAVRVLDQMSPF